MSCIPHRVRKLHLRTAAESRARREQQVLRARLAQQVQQVLRARLAQQVKQVQQVLKVRRAQQVQLEQRVLPAHVPKVRPDLPDPRALKVWLVRKVQRVQQDHRVQPVQPDLRGSQVLKEHKELRDHKVRRDQLERCRDTGVRFGMY